MFGIEQQRLVETLKKIRRGLCCYCSPASDDMCDCKYIKEEFYIDRNESGENTGCCEVRLALQIISAMTEKEFKRICKRGGIR